MPNRQANYQEWSAQLWAIHKKNGKVTTRDYFNVCNTSFSSASEAMDKHKISYPPADGSRGKYAEIRKLQHQIIVDLYEKLKRPLTKKEIENAIPSKVEARRRLDVLHQYGFELPPIEDWQPVEVSTIDNEDEEIEGRRWEVKGKPIKTTRIGGLLLGTPVGNKNGQTWYQIL